MLDPVRAWRGHCSGRWPPLDPQLDATGLGRNRDCLPGPLRDCPTLPDGPWAAGLPAGPVPLPGQPVRRALLERGWDRLRPVLLNVNTCKEALPIALLLRRTFKNTLQIFPWLVPVANLLKSIVWLLKL